MPTIKQNLTTVNRWVGGNTHKWIVVHNVGTKPQYEGAAYANTQYFKSVDRQASAHYFIDEGDVIWQCVGLNDRAWAVGESWSRNGCDNNNSISIEVCGNWKFTEKEIQNLRWLVQRLMDKYGIDEKHVVRHYDVTCKNCPAYYTNSNNWAALKSRITGSEAHWIWSESKQKWWYQFADGTYPKDEWEKIGGYWYHFDSHGYMQTGWLKLNEKWYYMDSKGHMLDDEWEEIKGIWYHFDSHGVAACNGLMKIDNSYFYFDSSCHMLAERWVETADEEWRYFLSNGHMAYSQWVEIKGNKYYFDKNGIMLVGMQEIDGKRYSFNTEHDGTFGACQTGWIEIDGSRHYFNPEEIRHTCALVENQWYAFDSRGTIIPGPIPTNQNGAIVLK